MIGLGPGARSYTRDIHYAMDFAVSRAAVLGVLQRYIGKDRADFGRVAHGIRLTQAEKMRRYLLKSLLHRDGLDVARFETLFGVPVQEAFGELDLLGQAGLLEDGPVVRLTPAGFERSDAIGPWLYSSDVAGRMQAFEPA